MAGDGLFFHALDILAAVRPCRSEALPSLPKIRSFISPYRERREKNRETDILTIKQISKDTDPERGSGGENERERPNHFMSFAKKSEKYVTS